MTRDPETINRVGDLADRAVSAVWYGLCGAILATCASDCRAADVPPQLLELEPGTWAVAAGIQHGERDGTPVSLGTLVIVKGGAGKLRYAATGCGQRGGQLADERGGSVWWLRGGTDRASRIATALCARHPGVPAAAEGLT